MSRTNLLLNCRKNTVACQAGKVHDSIEPALYCIKWPLTWFTENLVCSSLLFSLWGSPVQLLLGGCVWSSTKGLTVLARCGIKWWEVYRKLVCWIEAFLQKLTKKLSFKSKKFKLFCCFEVFLMNKTKPISFGSKKVFLNKLEQIPVFFSSKWPKYS